MDYIFRIIGSLGIVSIIMGMLKKNRIEEIVYFIIGGICLEIYSIHTGDIVFIALQMVFILSAVLKILEMRKNRK